MDLNEASAHRRKMVGMALFLYPKFRWRSERNRQYYDGNPENIPAADTTKRIDYALASLKLYEKSVHEVILNGRFS